LNQSIPPTRLLRSNAGDIFRNIMKRFLLDTNSLVAGLVSSKGASIALLQRVAAAKLEIAASTALWLEYEAVLKREELSALHGFSVAQIDSFLTALAVWLRPISLHYLWRPQLRDPGDEMVLEAAVNGRVDAIVTHNTRDFESAAPRFGVQVLTPAQRLTIL
jgi:putative PIN family toxin of toxin-antitoxin system